MKVTLKSFVLLVAFSWSCLSTKTISVVPLLALKPHWLSGKWCSATAAGTSQLRRTLASRLIQNLPRGEFCCHGRLKWDPTADKNEHSAKWVQQYSLLYSKEDNVPLNFEDHICKFPPLTELDEKPTLKDPFRAIDRLSLEKATWSLSISVEILRDFKSPLFP